MTESAGLTPTTLGLSDDIPDPDPEMAEQFCQAWFGSLADVDKLWISIFLLPSKKAFGAAYWQVLAALRDDSLWNLIRLANYLRMRRGDPEEMDLGLPPDSVYLGVVMRAARPLRNKRGLARDAVRSPGLWADLDFKPDQLRDWSHFMNVIERFDAAGIGPQITNYTGHGAHAYWRVQGGCTADEAELYGRAIRLKADEFAGDGIELDVVQDRLRVMRLPGSLRWPKPGEDSREVRLCTTVRSVEGFTDLGRVQQVTEDAVKRWEAVVVPIQREERAQHVAIEELVRMASSGGWGQMWSLAMLEEEFNASTSWQEILSDWRPVGKKWTKNGKPDDKGRQEWSRPGGDSHAGRSAVTDWNESPNVLSLLSMDASTGLRDLKTAGVALTKMRICAEYYYGGDQVALMKDWLSRRMR